MKTFKIQSGIPIPTAKGNTKGVFTPTYPFKDMKVGNSFKFSLKKYSSVTALASKFAKKTNTKFTIRRMTKTTARVWRIK